MIDYHSIYNDILPLHIGFCFLLGICFYLIKHEGTPKLKGYYIGRHLIAAGYMLIAIACFIEYYFLQDKSIKITQLIFFDIIAIDTALFSLGLTKMVDTSFITKRRVIFETAFIIIISLPLFTIYNYDGKSSLALTIAFTAGVVSLLIKQYFNYRLFHKRYLSAKEQLDNFYSNDMGVHLDWVNKSLALHSMLMFIALLGCTIPYFWVIITLIFIIWGSYLYIFISIINYSPKIMIIENVLEDNTLQERGVPNFIEPSQKAPDDKPEVAATIPVFTALDKWVSEEHFMNPGITIEEVATAIGTNRNKISLHLNTYLNVSFREWITKLRIEKARQLLLNEPELSIAEIGCKVSIPNRANFDKMFKKLIGESPASYRNKYSKTE